MGLVFTYLMTYGGSVVALFNPFIGLLIYICFAIIRPEALWHWSVPPGNYSRVIALSLLVGWALRGFGDWRFGRATPIVLCLVAFLGWACISATRALMPERAWEWIEAIGKIVLPFVVGMTVIDSTLKLKQLAWLILLGHGYVAYELNRAYLNGFNRLQEVGFGGMDNNCLVITFVTCCGLAFFLGLSARALWQKALAFGCLALMTHAILFSFSRGGMLGLIVVGIVAFLITPKRLTNWLVMLAIAAVAIRLAGPEVVGRFFSTFADDQQRDVSAQSRLDMWKICADAIASNPVFGLGPYHFPVHAAHFGLTEGKEAHSLWLQIGAELGLPGLSLLLLFYLVCIVRLWPVSRFGYPVPDPIFHDIARMVIASLAGFMVAAQFVSLPGLESPYYIVLIGAGALKLLSVPQYDHIGLGAAEPSDAATEEFEEARWQVPAAV